MEKHYVSPDLLTIAEAVRVVRSGSILALSEEAKKRVIHCREYLEHKLQQSDSPIYGINTGFGSLCDIKISDDELSLLQENLVKSHACGTGDYVPEHITKLMLLLKIQSLAYGHSGIRLETLERLIQHFNQDLLPVVYEQGSLGASGDLAPLAHLSLPLIGEGEVWQDGKPVPAKEILQQHQLEPLRLEAKEGLALLTGTQFMSAYATWVVEQSHRLMQVSDLIAALSLDVWNCKNDPFHPALHRIRAQSGQALTAAAIRHYREGSELERELKRHVQDPYSFRCIPQVHGASKAALAHVQQVVEAEINSVTDNPNIFPDEDLILSGGNFHGEPLAQPMDYLAIALSEISNISERRVYKLVSGQRDLPAFLVANPGVNSGLMIVQYTAASLVSQNKQLCTPASVDSITSSNGQEDHVSMGANGATKLLRVLNNSWNVLAIEMLAATQALHFRRPRKLSPFLEEVVERYRQVVPPADEDRPFYRDIERSREFLQVLELGERLGE